MNVNINLSKGKNVWHPQKYLKELKAIYRPSVTMEELKEKLDGTTPHYIEMMRYSADAKGTKTNEFCKVYQWGILKDWKNNDGEQLYVWETKTKTGKFGYTSYGCSPPRKSDCLKMDRK